MAKYYVNMREYLMEAVKEGNWDLISQVVRNCVVKEVISPEDMIYDCVPLVPQYCIDPDAVAVVFNNQFKEPGSVMDWLTGEATEVYKDYRSLLGEEW